MKIHGMKKINENFFVDKTKQLGKGNFGIVYKGYMLNEKRIIAVKFTASEQLAKNQDYQRELVVMEELSKMNHPNIMGYYGYEKTKQGLYCFIQFCAGGSLKQLVKKRISELKVMSLLKQLFQAMIYINNLNKVHRDLKPDNILLDQNLDLKIADFGLTRDIEIQMTKGACTPLYAAPEVSDSVIYDEKCDVWSAGLILYEMLTGKQFFEHIKTKSALKQQYVMFKKKQRKIKYPPQLHKNWKMLTQKMLTYDKEKRPSFKQMLNLFESIQSEMEADLSKKYEEFEVTNLQIRNSKMRAAQINPYLYNQSNNKGNENNNPQQGLQEQDSYKKFQKAQHYLTFLRMKTEFMCLIIKAFTSNTYSRLKNVYKYILMFLSVAAYISKLTECLIQLKNNRVVTPDGKLESKDLSLAHIKLWEQLIAEFKTKVLANIERFRNVSEKQIIQKITKTYMARDQEKKIISSYPYLLKWIEETKSGNFVKSKYYTDLFFKIMNEDAVYCTEAELKTLELEDVKTYAYLRLIGNLDEFLPDQEFMNQDFVRVKKQELEHLQKHQLIQYLKAFNNRTYSHQLKD